MSADTIPPGEQASDELTSGDAIAAMHDALVTVTKPADKRLTVRDINFERTGRWLVMKAKLNDGTTRIEFTVRMPKARAEQIRLRLLRALAS